MSLWNFAPILAAAVVQNPIDQLPQAAPRNLLGMRASDVMLLLGVAFVLALVLLVWAVYIRKPKREQNDRVFESRKYIEELDDGTIRKRKKHRRRRRDHRGRNPTLSEVGGLPPMKGDSATPPI